MSRPEVEGRGGASPSANKPARNRWLQSLVQWAIVLVIAGAAIFLAVRVAPYPWFYFLYSTLRSNLALLGLPPLRAIGLAVLLMPLANWALVALGKGIWKNSLRLQMAGAAVAASFLFGADFLDHQRQNVETRDVQRKKALDDGEARVKNQTAELDARESRIKAAEASLKARGHEATTSERKQQGDAPVREPDSKSPNRGDAIARSSTPLEPIEVLVDRTVMVPIAEGYYGITLKSYKRVGTSVYLYLRYRNDLPELVDFIMEAKGNTMFDNVGNQYAASVASFVGGLKSGEMGVLRGAFANAVLRFDGISADARTATALRTLTWWSSPSHPRSVISMGQRSYGDFENIPLSPQTP